MLRIADTFVVESPRTLDAALATLDHYGDKARLVAGGTDFMPNLKHGLWAPEVLINLKALRVLREVRLGDPIELGALLSLHDLAEHAELQRLLPSLTTAAGLVAGPQLRRMGTLGGNVCLDTRCVYINQTHFWRQSLGYCLKKDGDRCHVVTSGRRCVAAASNDTAPVLLSLGARLVLQSTEGERVVPITDFYVNDGVKNTVIAANEILTRIDVPRPSSTRRMSFQKLRVRDSIDFPLLNMALAFDLADGVVSDPVLYVSALASKPRLIKGLPEGPMCDALIDAACEVVHKRVKPLTNINADVQWRQDTAPVLLRRAFEQALAS